MILVIISPWRPVLCHSVCYLCYYQSLKASLTSLCMWSLFVSLVHVQHIGGCIQLQCQVTILFCFPRQSNPCPRQSHLNPAPSTLVKPLSTSITPQPRPFHLSQTFGHVNHTSTPPLPPQSNPCPRQSHLHARYILLIIYDVAGIMKGDCVENSVVCACKHGLRCWEKTQDLQRGSLVKIIVFNHWKETVNEKDMGMYAAFMAEIHGNKEL